MNQLTDGNVKQIVQLLAFAEVELRRNPNSVSVQALKMLQPAVNPEGILRLGEKLMLTFDGLNSGRCSCCRCPDCQGTSVIG